MLQIKELYDLPYNALDLNNWVLRDDWFPEINTVTSLLGGSALEKLQAEGRLQVRELVNVYGDGHRITEMCTVWFDGEPVFIAQNAGRSGRDHRKRWLTNTPRYWALLGYLFSMSDCEDEALETIDPSTLVYEEDVFNFYGQDFSAQFGYKTEPRTPGYCLLPHAEGIVPGSTPGWVLVMLGKSVAQAAPFIRRGGCVMQLLRPLSQAELDSNPRMTQALEGTEFDRYVWYVSAARPDNTVVLSV